MVSVDGSATAGDEATIIIGSEGNERRYTYTVQESDVPAEDDPDTEDVDESEPASVGLTKIQNALIALINENDPEVEAFAAGQFNRIRLRARFEGPQGNGIPYNKETSDGASVVLTATTSALCCANVAGARVTVDNPAIAGSIITVFATGLGLVEPEEAREQMVTGQAYDGPEINRAAEFVSSLAGGRTANVLFAGLERGTIGLYRVDLQLNQGLPTNPITGFTIAQGFQVSNIATIPVFNPDPGAQP